MLATYLFKPSPHFVVFVVGTKKYIPIGSCHGDFSFQFSGNVLTSILEMSLTCNLLSLVILTVFNNIATSHFLSPHASSLHVRPIHHISMLFCLKM
jgi:hypothetical protein